MFMTAKEARKLAKDNAHHLTKLMEPIMLGIRKRVNDQKFSFAAHVEYYTFTDEVILALKSLGYTIEGPDSTGFYVISW